MESEIYVLVFDGVGEIHPSCTGEVDIKTACPAVVGQFIGDDLFLEVVLLDGDVLTVDGDEVDAVAFLHFGFEDLALGELVLFVDGIVEGEAEGFLLGVEFVIAVTSSFVFD